MISGIAFVRALPITRTRILLICTCTCYDHKKLPESPRWLVKHGHNAEALAVISALEDKEISDATVQRTYLGIHEAISAEGGFDSGEKGSSSSSSSSSSHLKELFTHGRTQNFRRAALAVTAQCFQQITGINIITYYAVRPQFKTQTTYNLTHVTPNTSRWYRWYLTDTPLRAPRPLRRRLAHHRRLQRDRILPRLAHRDLHHRARRAAEADAVWRCGADGDDGAVGGAGAGGYGGRAGGVGGVAFCV